MLHLCSDCDIIVSNKDNHTTETANELQKLHFDAVVGLAWSNDPES
jgi:hypothetical protein